MAGIVTIAINIFIAILGLIVIYYLYKYLFSSSKTSVNLITGKQDATSYSPASILTGNLPPLYMGGEFAISTWFNVNNWGFAKGRNASILRIGNPATYDTLRIYLGGGAAQLMIRLDTHQTATSVDYLSNADTTQINDASIVFSQNKTLMGTTPIASSSNACDVVHIDLQRWINLVVSVNGMTCDVYIDGKLVRSCLLDNYYNVDPRYQLSILDNGGFGGYISTTQMYGQALSPDIVYQNYMAGPEPVGNFWDYLTSFFSTTINY